MNQSPSERCMQGYNSENDYHLYFEEEKLCDDLKAIRFTDEVDRAICVWVYLLARVHSRCFEKISVDDVEHGWIRIGAKTAYKVNLRISLQTFMIPISNAWECH